MSKIRRKVLIRIIERLALGLVALDAVLYFGLVRTLDRRAQSEFQSFSVMRHRFLEESERVARLDTFHSSLPQAKERIGVFEREHVPPRRRGFSRAASLVRELTGKSGLQLSNVAYRLDSARDAPLKRLGIEISVEGPFASLLEFTHALETSSEFVVVRDFTFEPLEGGKVGLRLGADLYLTP